MDIALIGYGKMGKAIEAIAVERGHRIVLTIDVGNLEDFTLENLQRAQVAVEFTKPETGFANVARCIQFGIPVVSGTTGWYHRLDEVKKMCVEYGGSMLCASNFSLGVNIFFELNKHLAEMMNHFPSYHVSIEETHHTQKLDAPSGTAITLAEGILEKVKRLKKWELKGGNSPDALPVHAIREDDVPGTHRVAYASDIDDIEIIHTAHNRTGLALGAVMAAEYIHDKTGIFTMHDLFRL
jgi:4-hydroxy-tetrahydrodipicolinate reductase